MDEPAPFAVEEIEHCWIEMPDGVRLAARLWLPRGAGPQPAILEYIPYRKRDMVRARDERNHPVFAAHGYACLRVDMRGSGDSEGVMPDMYAPDELADARHVIDWIAAQPWCDGKVGMFGTSWGGTASLQAAVDAPGPLKAVIANCATADRFEDDIHWMGGCLLTDSVEWGATLPAILAAPPDPATVGGGWRDLWETRLQGLTFPLGEWMARARRGDYWRRGSTLFDADRLAAPILAIGGWADRYSNTVIRLTAARPDLCWGVVGPWGHHYPDQGEPGPALIFQGLALDWWDHWLRGEGALDWPRLRLWRREFDPPQNRLAQRNGAWLSLGQKPQARTLHLTAEGDLAEGAASPGEVAIPFDLRHGEAAGDTGYFGRVGGLPLDQAPDDARALRFEMAMTRDLDIVGAASLTVAVRRERAEAQLVARLCDVAPDGRSNLITRAILNLDLDATLEASLPFDPDAPQKVALTFPTTAYRMRAGHRLRLSLAGSYWPIAFPPGQDPGMRLLTHDAALTLPAPGEAAEAPFDAPVRAQEAAERRWVSQAEPNLDRHPPREEGPWRVMGWRQPQVSTHFPEIDVTLSYETSAEYRAKPDPQDVRCRIEHKLIIVRPDGVAEMLSIAEVTSDAKGPQRSQTLDVRFDGEPVLSRRD